MTDNQTPNLLGIPAWTAVQTEGWLTEYPLPVGFTWPDRYGKPRAPMPSYRLKGGYGKWLRETPYFPGLFERCHEILLKAPDDALLTPEWLAEELNKQRAEQTATLL